MRLYVLIYDPPFDKYLNPETLSGGFTERVRWHPRIFQPGFKEFCYDPDNNRFVNRSPLRYRETGEKFHIICYEGVPDVRSFGSEIANYLNGISREASLSRFFPINEKALKILIQEQEQSVRERFNLIVNFAIVFDKNDEEFGFKGACLPYKNMFLCGVPEQQEHEYIKACLRDPLIYDNTLKSWLAFGRKRKAYLGKLKRKFEQTFNSPDVIPAFYKGDASKVRIALDLMRTSSHYGKFHRTFKNSLKVKDLFLQSAGGKLVVVPAELVGVPHEFDIYSPLVFSRPEGSEINIEPSYRAMETPVSYQSFSTDDANYITSTASSTFTFTQHS